MKKTVSALSIAIATTAVTAALAQRSAAQCELAPRAECAAGGSFLAIRDRNGYRDRIYWSWEGDPGRLPTGTTRFALCLYERLADGSEALALDWGLSADAGWTQARRGARYRHRRATATRAIETSVRFHSGQGIEVRILGPDLPLPPLPVRSNQIRVQFVGEDGSCWESVLPSPALRNGPRVFWDSVPE